MVDQNNIFRCFSLFDSVQLMNVSLVCTVSLTCLFFVFSPPNRNEQLFIHMFLFSSGSLGSVSNETHLHVYLIYPTLSHNMPLIPHDAGSFKLLVLLMKNERAIMIFYKLIK